MTPGPPHDASANFTSEVPERDQQGGQWRFEDETHSFSLHLFAKILSCGMVLNSPYVSKKGSVPKSPCAHAHQLGSVGISLAGCKTFCGPLQQDAWLALGPCTIKDCSLNSMPTDAHSQSRGRMQKSHLHFQRTTCT